MLALLRALSMLALLVALPGRCCLGEAGVEPAWESTSATVSKDSRFRLPGLPIEGLPAELRLRRASGGFQGRVLKNFTTSASWKGGSSFCSGSSIARTTASWPCDAASAKGERVCSSRSPTSARSASSARAAAAQPCEAALCSGASPPIPGASKSWHAKPSTCNIVAESALDAKWRAVSPFPVLAPKLAPRNWSTETVSRLSAYTA
mmetsp:Transcript_91451/g.295920  ORF Transcript_91451/g.295920 Transcript_91451/m.295920 type:complete len:206 (+) Transcript_91451:353-970(+)